MTKKSPWKLGEGELPVEESKSIYTQEFKDMLDAELQGMAVGSDDGQKRAMGLLVKHGILTAFHNAAREFHSNNCSINEVAAALGNICAAFFVPVLERDNWVGHLAQTRHLTKVFAEGMTDMFAKDTERVMHNTSLDDLMKSAYDDVMQKDKDKSVK